jgi:hypothetical protein
MFLQAGDVGAVQEFGIEVYVCAAIVMVICFVIAFKHMTDFDD